MQVEIHPGPHGTRLDIQCCKNLLLCAPVQVYRTNHGGPYCLVEVDEAQPLSGTPTVEGVAGPIFQVPVCTSHHVRFIFNSLVQIHQGPTMRDPCRAVVLVSHVGLIYGEE